MDSDRYDRQRRLKEVGDQGQQRIEASEARLGAGPEASVALSYLCRAGVSRLMIDSALSNDSRHAAWFRFSGPRAVAHGAECALAHLLHVLEMP